MGAKIEEVEAGSKWGGGKMNGKSEKEANQGPGEGG